MDEKSVRNRKSLKGEMRGFWESRKHMKHLAIRRHSRASRRKTRGDFGEKNGGDHPSGVEAPSVHATQEWTCTVRLYM